MKKKIAWIIDSTGLMSDKLRHHPDVFCVPLSIQFEGKEYKDNVDLTTDELYARIRNEKEIPKTSQPSPGTFSVLYEALKEKYDEAIAVHASSKLSGTIGSSQTGAQLADFKVTTIDSGSLSGGLTGLIEEGIDLHEQGYTVEEIVKALKEKQQSHVAYALVGQLEQLKKSGRVTGIQFFIGSLLNIKPIVRIEDGQLIPDKKIRSEKRAVRYLRDLVLEQKEKIKGKLFIVHGNVLEKAKSLKEDLLNDAPHLSIEIGDINSSLATHAGEGSLAVLWFTR